LRSIAPFPISIYVPHSPAVHSPRVPLVQNLLNSRRGLSGKAIRLYHPEREQSAETLHRRQVRRRGSVERTQCWAEPVDSSVETVEH